MNPAILLTSSRLILALFFTFFFTKAVQGNLYEANLVFLLLAISFALLIELSDAFDGFIARRNNQVTKFGKVFDPMCDSVSRQTIFCSFMLVGIIPIWIFLIFLYRDAILSLMRIIRAIDGSVMAAKKSGKLKAIIQAIGIFLVLLVVLSHSLQSQLIPKLLGDRHPGFWIMLVPTLITITSMFDYLIPNWPIIKKIMVPDN